MVRYYNKKGILFIRKSWKKNFEFSNLLVLIFLNQLNNNFWIILLQWWELKFHCINHIIYNIHWRFQNQTKDLRFKPLINVQVKNRNQATKWKIINTFMGFKIDLYKISALLYDNCEWLPKISQLNFASFMFSCNFLFQTWVIHVKSLSWWIPRPLDIFYFTESGQELGHYLSKLVGRIIQSLE